MYRQKVILNNLNVSGILKAEGLTQDEVYRQEREVVTLDGVSHYVSIPKRTLSLEFVPITDESWWKICQAIKKRPVMVQYYDEDTGEAAKYFIVRGKSSTARKVIGNTTTVGPSLTLEEV